jgi:predicted nucleic acid-binding protein
MTQVLVDTSVFISFFKGKSPPGFEDLPMKNQIVLSPIVELELTQGVRKNEVQRLRRVLSGLIKIPFDPEIFPLANAILESVKNSGLTLGIPDLLLAAEANVNLLQIYSLDKVFDKLTTKKLVKTYRFDS